jgi:sulfotransferase family protein
MDFRDDQYDTHELSGLIHHSGVLTEDDLTQCLQNNEITVDGILGIPTTPMLPGSQVSIRGAAYRVHSGGGNGRLQLIGIEPTDGHRIGGKIRVHAGYHKCLSEYAKKVYRRTCENPVLRNSSFKHYYHRHDAFYADCARHTITSISGHCVELERFDDIRVVRFIRDPRDLLVSGYFYHKRGAEHWCALGNATDMDWKMVNGAVPPTLPTDTSLTYYLNQVPLEEGLLAELEFRRHHFDSMLSWPERDPRVRLFRYEDILGNEAAVFGEIFDFYGFSYPARFVAKRYAHKYRAGSRSSKKKHIRNPNAGQWRQYFTPRIHRVFNEQFSHLLDRYNYPLD